MNLETPARARAALPRLLTVALAASLATAAPAAPPAPSAGPPASPAAPAAPPAQSPAPLPAPPPAQSPASPPTAPAESPPADPLAGLPPQVRIGARSAHTRRNLPVVPAVVVVPDAASYVAAIAEWSIYVRYPVLIDDGSWAARQDIARFVRDFRPESVVRWSAGDGDGAAAAWPEDPRARREAVENAVAAAWDAPPSPPSPNAAGLRKRWEEISLTPMGVVATHEGDPAWTAALALAAGRGQIIAWVPPSPGDINGHADLRAIDALGGAIEKACADSGYSWNALGDDLDAITLCLDFPVKVDLGESSKARFWASTDVLGRSREGERDRRWAWAGQVFGDEPRAAYRAMCALFLRPHNAWLFDGYEPAEPWSQWDATRAAIELERAGIATVVNDNDQQSADEFRLRAAGRSRAASAAATGPDRGRNEGESFGGVRFGLIAINSSGEPGFFDLRPGRCLSGDVPILARPAVVHMVHSWSAVRPGDRATVAGRFLEHGAYAYIGSVHEPYLQGFVPTPIFALRLRARAPLGVAARHDNGPPWKIAVLGDPLITLGPAPAAQPLDKLPLTGARSVQDSLAAALKERRFDQAVADLSLLARDEDIARLIRALAADKAYKLDPDTALAAAMGLYLAGAFDTLVEVFPLAAHGGGGAGGGNGSPPAPPPALRDILWHTLWPTLRTLRPGEISLLRINLRPDQMARDAAELATAIRHSAGAGGAEAAREFLADIRPQLPSDDERRLLDELLKQP